MTRLTGRRSVVQLRLVLTGPARVRFLVVGPAPSCRVVGHLVLAGHRGPNKLTFRGRVRGRLLGPGTYTIVPQPAAHARRLPKALAVRIDARGVRPNAPVRWRNCGPAAAVPARTTGDVVPDVRPSGAGGDSDVAAAETTMTAQDDKPAAKRLAAGAGGLLPSVQKSSLLAALLLAQLAFSLALLTVASLGPRGVTMRFPAGQVVARHWPQIAFVGGALLIGTGVLFLLAQLTS
jgi:hypothetical protein